MSLRALPLLAVLTLAACRPATMMTSNCVRPSDCPEGLVCRSGLCDRCGADIDCPSGLRCDAPGTPTARCASPDAGPVDGAVSPPDGSAPDAPAGVAPTLTAQMNQTLLEPGSNLMGATMSVADCGEGSVLLGVNGLLEGTQFIAQVRPVCGTIRVAGGAGAETVTLGEGVEGAPLGGPPVNGVPFSLVCPRGQLLMGFRLQGRPGAVLSLGFDCASPMLSAGRIVLGMPSSLSVANMQAGPLTMAQCPPNTFARGLRYAQNGMSLLGLGLACYAGTYP